MAVGMEQYQGLALQQTLSPQMQQSLNILQAPITELRQLVAQELAENPVLEEIGGPTDANEPKAEASTSGLEDEWGDYYTQASGGERWTQEDQERRQHFFDSQTREQTLLEHLDEQLALGDFTDAERRAAQVIIGNIDENGYYPGPIEEAAYPIGCTVAEAEEALEKVQGFDPAGVGARDLRECLLIQLRRGGHGDDLAARIVDHHLDDLARRRLPELAKTFSVPVAEVVAAGEQIKALNPRPGRIFAANENPLISPDILVSPEDDGRYIVSLNQTDLPHLRISNSYKDLIGMGKTTREVRDFLRERIRGGRFFMKCLEQRNSTLLAIAQVIVDRQQDFLEQGPEALRPMTMSQVAQEVGVHETTVSRAVSGKYLKTPQGLFELKYFFTSGYRTDGGEAVSNESVRKAIQELVRMENSAKPFSDQQLVKELSERGLKVARRTVAKYREQLGILPSHMRKEYR